MPVSPSEKPGKNKTRFTGQPQPPERNKRGEPAEERSSLETTEALRFRIDMAAIGARRRSALPNQNNPASKRQTRRNGNSFAWQKKEAQQILAPFLTFRRQKTLPICIKRVRETPCKASKKVQRRLEQKIEADEKSENGFFAVVIHKIKFPARAKGSERGRTGDGAVDAGLILDDVAGRE